MLKFLVKRNNTDILFILFFFEEIRKILLVKRNNTFYDYIFFWRNSKNFTSLERNKKVEEIVKVNNL